LARPQSAQDARGRLRAVLLTALLLAAAGCRSRFFAVSGTITVAAPLHARVPKMNSVLFIVLKNRGGVPVAVHRIVNPQFPVDFSIETDDLVVPNSRPAGPLTLEIEMNTHGNVGHPVKGDLAGTHPDAVYPGERGVHVVIDHVF
jgi:hypothetical protein